MGRKNAASVTGPMGIRFSWRPGRNVRPLGRQHVTGRNGAMFSNSHRGELVNDVGMMIIWPIGVGIPPGIVATGMATRAMMEDSGWADLF